MNVDEKDRKLKQYINTDPAVGSMAGEYFKLLMQEDIGKTPGVTAKLNSLEEAIRDRRDKLIKKEKEQ